MAASPDRTMKRHIREKAVIDHVAKDVHESKPADDEPTVHSPTTPAGLLVEEQVRKEWDPRKGGLPIL
jgi:hypothetical protein